MSDIDVFTALFYIGGSAMYINGYEFVHRKDGNSKKKKKTAHLTRGGTSPPTTRGVAMSSCKSPNRRSHITTADRHNANVFPVHPRHRLHRRSYPQGATKHSYYLGQSTL